tara:strand:+ start:607 stop:1131 length:525 start_codon:yes stop_codon:yes gene_type:complete
MEHAFRMETNETEPAPFNPNERLQRGLMNQKAELNYQKKCWENKTNQLYKIIMKYGGEEGVREAYDKLNLTVQVPYFAIKGEWTNKKGETKICWKTAHGKYAGKYVNDEYANIPILNGYVGYRSCKDDLVYEANYKHTFRYCNLFFKFGGEDVEQANYEIQMASDSEDESEDEN